MSLKRFLESLTRSELILFRKADNVALKLSKCGSAIPNPSDLTRLVNRLRLKGRPKEPKTLDCGIALDYIEDL